MVMNMKMIFKYILAMILLPAAVQTAKADDIVFKASAPEAVAMGEQFRLTYTINTEATELRAPDFTDFQVLMGPSTSTSRNIQINNGTTTNVYTLSFTYIMMPKQEGTFNVPPATIKVKNSTYTSNELVIKVLPPNSQTQSSENAGDASTGNIKSDDLFVNMIVSNRNMYEQEGFLVTFKLYSAVGVTVAGVSNLKFPEFEGFLVNDIEVNSQWKLENYNGKNYQTAILKQSILNPQRSGEITIGSGRFDVVVRIRTQKRVRSFFDDLLDTYQDVNKVIVSSPVKINVKPLPSGKPASFSGAVGDFAMKTKINSDHIKANEAVTITVTLTGTGNLKVAKNPEVVFPPNDFDIYDPKVDSKITISTGGTSGTKTIEYMAIPRFGGEFDIPEIKFSYFDIKSGTYKTLSSEAFHLQVDKGEGGEGGNAPVISNFSTQQNLNMLGEDIRYIKLTGAHFTQNKDIFFGSISYILVYVIITLLFALFFIIYRKQLKENANIALVRTKKANKMAVRRLKTAEKLLRTNQKEAFYEETLRAVWGYLSDKLNIPLSSLTKENVEAELSNSGIDAALSDEFIDILNTCEFARYAPSQAPDAMDQLFKQTNEAISKMENTIKK